MASDELLPEKIGRYEIVLQIARGGMATVYLGRAEGVGGFDRYVAVKLTAEHLRDDEEFAQHLIDEAKLVAHLKHTNVVPVLDVGEDDDNAIFLVMDYIPGDSLGGLMRLAKRQNRVVPPRIGLRILIDALGGLHAAHEHTDEDGNPHLVVHRDFSPQNILVGTDGIARLTDFGIAKAASRASITMAGTMKGKVSYASPEQARGQPLDRRCDVWAGGVVAWELLASRKLYPANEGTLREIVKAPPPHIREIVPTISPEIDEVIANALAMDVASRTPTALAYARALTTAARQADMLADIDEVADYVRKAVGPVLAERRAKIDEARRLRAQNENPGSEGKVVTKVSRLAALPELPLEPERVITRPALDSKIDETIPMAKDELAATLAVAEGSSDAPEITTTDDRPPESWFTPSVTPSGVARETVDPPPEVPMRSAPIAIDSLLAKANDLVARGRRFAAEKPKVAIGIAGGGFAVLLLFIVAIAALGGDRGSGKNAKGDASASPSSLAVRPSDTAPTRTTSSPPSTTPREEAEALPPQLGITANAPIARVRIGRRNVEVEVAAPHVAFELSSDEAASSIGILATSVDGRTASATWTASGGDVSITFGDAPPPARPAGGRKPLHGPRR